MLVYGAILPHPPIAVPEVGGQESNRVKDTQDAMLEVGRRMRESGAETLVMISPHSPVHGYKFGINAAAVLEGDLGHFGAPQVRFKCACDGGLAGEIKRQARDIKVEAEAAGLDAGEEQIRERGGQKARRNARIELKGYFEMDHGLLVPLYFLKKAGVDLPLVPISIAFSSLEEHYAFGKTVAEAARALNRKIAVVASGDLSHRLMRGAPAGYDPRGKEFDTRVKELVEGTDARGLLDLDSELVERAGECGLRPIIMFFGAFDGYDLKSEVLSYEGPFGVGYMVAVVEPQGEAGLSGETARAGNAGECGENRSQPSCAGGAGGSGEAGESGENAKAGVKGEKGDSAGTSARESVLKASKISETAESYLVKRARESLESYVRGKWKRPEERDDVEIPDEFKHAAGAFVSIKKHGRLRGCIGTVVPQRDNVVYEVIYNAVAAGTDDPRFPPVTEDELGDLEYSVDVLGKPEPINSINELDPKKYGVIVRKDFRSGLLLPDLEGIDTAEEQVDIARRKAGIAPHEEVKLERFEVKRYGEKD